MAEGDTFAVAALVRKRAEVAGRIAHATAEIAKMRGTLAAIDTALGLFDPEIRAELIPPKRHQPPSDGPWVEVGGRVLLEFLRRANEPLDARMIAARLLAEAGHDGNGSLLERARETVRKALRSYRAKGVVASRQGPRRGVLWELTGQGEATDDRHPLSQPAEASARHLTS